MTPEILNLYGKAENGLYAGVLSWLGNSVAQVIAPDQSWALWLDRYGLPLVMLVIALYVIRALYLALQKEQEKRIADKDESVKLWRADFIAAQEGREKIANKLDEQTAELKALKGSLQDRNQR